MGELVSEGKKRGVHGVWQKERCRKESKEHIVGGWESKRYGRHKTSFRLMTLCGRGRGINAVQTVGEAGRASDVDQSVDENAC